MSQRRIEFINKALRARFKIAELRIRDDSALHAGHASAAGAGHFAVFLVSEDFAGLSAVKRHQAVFAAVSEFMGSEIHALSIEAKTPQEIAPNT